MFGIVIYSILKITFFCTTLFSKLCFSLFYKASKAHTSMDHHITSYTWKLLYVDHISMQISAKGGGLKIGLVFHVDSVNSAEYFKIRMQAVVCFNDNKLETFPFPYSMTHLLNVHLASQDLAVCLLVHYSCCTNEALSIKAVQHDYLLSYLTRKGSNSFFFKQSFSIVEFLHAHMHTHSTCAEWLWISVCQCVCLLVCFQFAKSDMEQRIVQEADILITAEPWLGAGHP